MSRYTTLLLLVHLLICATGNPANSQPPQHVPQQQIPSPHSGTGNDEGMKTKVQFTIGEGNVVRLPSSVMTVAATNVAALENMEPEAITKYAASFTIVDSGVSHGPEIDAAVKFTAPEFIGLVGTDGLTWRVRLEARAPLGTSHERLATVSFGVPKATTYALQYAVTTKPAAAAQWTVRGASDVWTISWSDQANARVLGVAIENQDEHLSNVRIALSTLKDASGHIIGADRLSLVSAPAMAGGAFEAAPNKVTPLFIRLEALPDTGWFGAAESFGTFDGTIKFTADGNSALKDLQLKIQASSRDRKATGIGITLLGLLAAAGVTALLRPQFAHLQAKRAAATLRNAIARLVAEADRVLPAGAAINTMKAVATDLSMSLSTVNLKQDGLLPPAYALPGADATTEMLTALKERLDAVSKKLEGLFVLLRTGAPRLLALATRDPQAAPALLQELAEAASKITSVVEAQAAVKLVHDKIPQVAHELAEREAVPTTKTEMELRQLDFQIGALSFAAWSLWLIVVLIIGASWIASDADYGTTIDLVSSFLWGFGATTFGAGIQNLTPASVTTQMNVRIPK
jgi:hypothetical protein